MKNDDLAVAAIIISVAAFAVSIGAIILTVWWSCLQGQIAELIHDLNARLRVCIKENERLKATIGELERSKR